MSQWWVFHEDKVDEAVAAWLGEMHPPPTPEQRIEHEIAVKAFLNSAALKRLGMRKE